MDQQQNLFAMKDYILAIAAAGSFTRAAKELYISQPSLSNTVRRLEERLGFPLFDRSTNPVRLTAQGEQYVRSAEQLRHVEEDFLRYVNDLQELAVGDLRLGGSNFFSSYILPPFISRFTGRFPGVRTTLKEAGTGELEALTLSDGLDLIMDNFEFDRELFDRFPCFEEELLLAVPRKFLPEDPSLSESLIPAEEFLADDAVRPERPPVKLSLFRSVPFVLLKAGNDTAQRAERLCRRHRFTPKTALELDQLLTSYHVCCTGLGACLVSDSILRRERIPEEIAVFQLDRDICRRTICFYCRRGRYITAAMREFLKLAAPGSAGIPAGATETNASS